MDFNIITAITAFLSKKKKKCWNSAFVEAWEREKRHTVCSVIPLYPFGCVTNKQIPKGQTNASNKPKTHSRSRLCSCFLIISTLSAKYFMINSFFSLIISLMRFSCKMKAATNELWAKQRVAIGLIFPKLEDALNSFCVEEKRKKVSKWNAPNLVRG